jgi:hypothetical protein
LNLLKSTPCVCPAHRPGILGERRHHDLVLILAGQAYGIDRAGTDAQPASDALFRDDAIGIVAFLDGGHLAALLGAEAAADAGVLINDRIERRVYDIPCRIPSSLMARRHPAAARAAVADEELTVLQVVGEMHKACFFGHPEDLVGLFLGDDAA